MQWSSFYRQGNWGTKRLSNLSKVTWVACGRDGTWNQAVCGQPQILVSNHHIKMPRPLSFCWLGRPLMAPVMAHELVDSLVKPPPASQHWHLPLCNLVLISPCVFTSATHVSPEHVPGSLCSPRAVPREAAVSQPDSYATWKPWELRSTKSQAWLCLPSLTTRFTLKWLPSMGYKTTLEAASSQSSRWGLGEKHSLPPSACICKCVLSCFSHVWLFATLWTVASQAPLSMGFSRQGYWSGLPCPSPGDFPSPGIEPHLMSPVLHSLPLVPPRKPLLEVH